MNTVLLLAALTTGQCEGAQCVVAQPPTIISLVSKETVVCEKKVTCHAKKTCHARKPLRRVAKAIKHRKPVRTFFRTRKPARRLVGALFCRRCR
jgi:hypothetical protein